MMVQCVIYGASTSDDAADDDDDSGCIIHQLIVMMWNECDLHASKQMQALHPQPL